MRLLACYDYIICFVLTLIFIAKYDKLNSFNKIVFKGFFLVLSIDMMLTTFNYIFSIDFSYIYIFETFFIYWCLFCKIISWNIKSETTINKENIYLILYKPQTISQYLRNIKNIDVCSTGILCWQSKENSYYSYQMRYGFNTLQKIKYSERLFNDLFKKYIVVKTDILVEDLNNKFSDWECVLQKQKARQWRTLYRRRNCLRSFRFIFNEKYSKQFIYRDLFLPLSPEINLIKWRVMGII